MSLLMDALKKAELAKRQNQDEAAVAAEFTASPLSLELEPLPGTAEPAASNASPAVANPVAAPAKGVLPELPKHLEALDDEFLAHHASQRAAQKPRPSEPLTGTPAVQPADSAPRRPVQAATSAASNGKAEQAAAQNAFAAKRPAKSGNKAFGILVGVTTLVAALGIGAYFWWQLQPKSGTPGGDLLAMFKSTPPPSPPRPPAQPIPAAPPAAAAPVAQAPPATPAVPQTAVPPAPTSAKALATKPSKAGDDEEEDERPTAPPPPARAQPAKPAPSMAADRKPVQVTRSPPKVNPALSDAFEALGKGDLAAAQTDYERVLKTEPRNVDALHGLAAVALRQKRLADADQYYRRVLDVDPKDPVAIAELINLRGQSDPLAAESRLKALIAGQPDLAQPHFALGNLYAAQGRWNEAQNAYFKAFTAEADNPDILFNLAISLEHLRQNRLALQYYQQALAMSQTRPSGFDKAQASARIRALQP